ncbi:MAG TPA: hypothetical protein VGK58_07015 [Lacipirellulaceae bacterium]
MTGARIFDFGLTSADPAPGKNRLPGAPVEPRISDGGLPAGVEVSSAAGVRNGRARSGRQSGIQNLRPILFAAPIALLWLFCSVADRAHAVELRVAAFKLDVTPPVGSPLCDALVPAMTGVNDPLTARGIVLAADDQEPVVLVAVDWVGIGNEGQDAWREAIAEACGTERDRVCVHALHQHDAPGCDFLADRIAGGAGLSGKLFPVEFARDAIRRAAAAAAEAQSRLAPVTHVGYGSGRVEKVASNRRILGTDGKVEFVRYTATTDPKLRAFPEGTIDPLVKLVSFWDGDRCLAVLSYYATHPQSYYYTGKVSADFVGMARDQREAAENADVHVHFNGAGGNIGAGKYNDGSPENRPVLAGRLADGMKLAWDDMRKAPAADVEFDWATAGVQLPLADWLDEAELLAVLNNTSAGDAPRLRAARDIAWARRVRRGRAISVGRLRLGAIDILHLPGELFVEFQLAAQTLRPDRFICVAAYGDYGPGYIGTAEAYSQGGYETGAESRVSRVSPRAEAELMRAIGDLLQ